MWKWNNNPLISFGTASIQEEWYFFKSDLVRSLCFFLYLFPFLPTFWLFIWLFNTEKMELNMLHVKNLIKYIWSYLLKHRLSVGWFGLLWSLLMSGSSDNFSLIVGFTLVSLITFANHQHTFFFFWSIWYFPITSICRYKCDKFPQMGGDAFILLPRFVAAPSVSPSVSAAINCPINCPGKKLQELRQGAGCSLL